MSIDKSLNKSLTYILPFQGAQWLQKATALGPKIVSLWNSCTLELLSKCKTR